MVRFHHLAGEYAVEAISVDSRGPAGQAGLRDGDLIVAINGQSVGNVDDLHRFLSEWPVGEGVNLSIIRGRERLELSVTPTETRTSVPRRRAG